mgnify:CR=1 FL=1
MPDFYYESVPPAIEPLEVNANIPNRVLHVLDLDDVFNQTHDKVILNRFDFGSDGYGQKLSEAIFSRATDIDFVARCDCEHLQGNFYLGHICPKCHTPVVLDTDLSTGYLQHKAWLECPRAIDGWINPSAFFVLSRWMSYGKRVGANYTNAKGDLVTKGKKRKGNFLEDILDVTMPLPDELLNARYKGNVNHPDYTLQGEAGTPVFEGSGFNYFHQNFDRIMQYFLYEFKKTANKKDTESIALYLKKHRNVIWCRYLPVLSSSLHSVVMSEGTRENRKRYVDKICQYVQHAAQTLSYLEFSPAKHRSHEDAEAATLSAYQEMIAYCNTISRKQLSAKRALLRMHVYGSRTHLSGRAVIVPITGPMAMDELHIPWSMAVNLFRVDIIGVLIREHDHNFGDAYNRQQRAIVMFDPLINQIMLRFIQECPYKGIPVLWTRNPSIRAGSTMLCFITKIKISPEDETVGMPSPSTPPSNADFDGD